MRATFLSVWTLFLLAFFFLGASFVDAAVIKGSVYTLYLDSLDKAVVTIDSTPQQTLVSKGGVYSFTVPRGRYTLRAVYEENDILYTAEEQLLITADGEYVADLILVPEIEEGLVLDNETQEEFGTFEAQTSLLGFVITMIMILFFLMYIILTKAHFIQEEQETPRKPETPVQPVQQPSVEHAVPLAEGEDATEKILAFIRESGGRVTQKELRKTFQLSEAKISLLVAELEAKNLIRKIKKGRGNILVLAS